MNSSRSQTMVALAREHLARGLELTLDAEGHSMWPLIQAGDRLVVQPLRGAPIIGDIVLIGLRDRLVLHRVIAISGFGITTKGDAVAHADPRVPRDDIIGTLARATPAFNRACAFASAHAGRPLAMLLQRIRHVVGSAPCA